MDAARTLPVEKRVVRVAIPRADLGHPRFILRAFATAQFFFYRSIDQDFVQFKSSGELSRTAQWAGRYNISSSAGFPSSYSMTPRFSPTARTTWMEFWEEI